jgi:hypothetical protein
MNGTLGQPDDRGNRVAILTRTAPVQPAALTLWALPKGATVRDLDAEGRVVTVAALPRPPQRVTVKHGGTEIDIIAVHLKSKLLSFPGGLFSTTNETLRTTVGLFAVDRRAAEAMTVRQAVNGLLAAKRNVIVLGDFNEGPDAATTEMFYGPAGGQPRGPEDAATASCAFQRADNADAVRLFNVCRFVPEEDRWSRVQDGRKELLDNILASEGLMPRQGELRQVPAVTIGHASSSPLGAAPRTTDVVPDHAPVTARFGG